MSQTLLTLHVSSVANHLNDICFGKVEKENGVLDRNSVCGEKKKRYLVFQPN